MATATDPNTVKKNNSLNTKAGLVFPSDLQTNYKDFCSIRTVKYTRNLPHQSPTTTAIGGSASDTVFLPMPIAGFEDKFNINYNTDALGVIGGFVNTLKNGASVNDILNGVMGAAGKGAGDLALLGGSELIAGRVDAATGAINAKLGIGITGIGDKVKAGGSQILGKSQNPNLSLSFQGVDLKTHSFTWRLIAKTPEESRSITQIMKFFKKNALPSKSSEFALDYPNIFFVDFHGQQEKLIVFSDQGLFLDNIDFKFDNGGSLAFFKDTGAPVSVTMSISFKERTIITAEDIV